MIHEMGFGAGIRSWIVSIKLILCMCHENMTVIVMMIGVGLKNGLDDLSLLRFVFSVIKNLALSPEQIIQ